MGPHEVTVTHIECGVAGDIAKDPKHFFWPVFCVKYLPIDWKPLFQKDFSICFTSKHALKAFQNRVLPFYYQKHFWHNCKLIGAVGEKTASHVKLGLPSFFFEKSKDVIFPNVCNGLLPLLVHLKENYPHHKLVVIFTSQVGKTSQIVDKIQSEFNLQCEVVPIYTLVNFDVGQDVVPFTSMLQNREIKNSYFYFYCRSGQIVKRVVNLLMNFFNVINPVNLPSFIFFSVWENSAREALLELNLIDREIS